MAPQSSSPGLGGACSAERAEVGEPERLRDAVPVLTESSALPGAASPG